MCVLIPANIERAETVATANRTGQYYRQMNGRAAVILAVALIARRFSAFHTADGPYNKTGYRLEHREDGFAITVGLMEYISGWSALEILYWLNEKQATPRRYDNAERRRKRMYV